MTTANACLCGGDRTTGCVVECPAGNRREDRQKVAGSLQAATLTSEKLEELKALALAATPGEWRVSENNNPFGDGCHVFAEGFDGTDFIVLNLKMDQTFVTATSREQQQKNALFSAAANPATVLALISQAEALAEAAERAEANETIWSDIADERKARILALEATIRKLASTDRDDVELCPICIVAFEAEDMCQTDIEMGACHAACLEGSAIVNLETGEPSDGPVCTYRYDSLPDLTREGDVS